MKFRRRLSLCFALVGLAMIGGMAWWVLTSPSILEQKAQRIKTEMSLKEVEEIMGGPGKLLKDSSPEWSVCQWEDKIGIVFVGFNDGMVPEYGDGSCYTYYLRRRESFWSRIRGWLGL